MLLLIKEYVDNKSAFILDGLDMNRSNHKMTNSSEPTNINDFVNKIHVEALFNDHAFLLEIFLEMQQLLAN